MGNGNVSIAAGAIMDLSGVTGGVYNFNNTNTVIANGTGVTVGGNAATINGPVGGVVNLSGNPVTLTYDGSHPALYVSQGTLNLVNNPFTINTTNSQPLANGIYPIMQQVSGYAGVAGPFTITGSAIPAGATTTVISSNNIVYLTINTTYSNTTNTQASPVVRPGAAIINNGGTANSSGTFYWIGNNTNYESAASWSTSSNSIVTSAYAPGSTSTFTSGGVGIFSISISNNAAVMASANSGYGIGGYIINNSNTTTITDSTPPTDINGFTNGASSSYYGADNITYGVVVNPGAGAVTVSGLQPDGIASTNQVWLNNGNGLFTINSPTTPGSLYFGLQWTLGGAGNFLMNFGMQDSTAATPVELIHNGGGTLYLSFTNDYHGGVAIQAGTVSLTNSGTLGQGGLSISAGGILDVSAYSSAVFNLTTPYTNALTVSGTGTNFGVNAASINGAAGGTVNLASVPITMTYDGSDPALYVSQGTLYLQSNAFVINTASTLPLTNGTYVIAQQQVGNIASGGNYTISGSALGAGATTSIVASNNVLLLTISGASTNAQAITSSGSTLWWIGSSGATFETAANWSTTSTNVTVSSVAPSATTTEVYNYPGSNVNETVVAIGNADTIGAMIFNSAGAIVVSNNNVFNGFQLSGGLTSGGVYYGMIVNAGAGAVTIYQNPAATVPGLIYKVSNQTWLNNSTNLFTFNGNFKNSVLASTVSPNDLFLSGSGNMLFTGSITESGASTSLALIHNGTGTTFLNATNNYSGGTFIQSGTIALTNSGTLGSSNNTVISAGATLDVSGLTTNNFTMSSGSALTLDGTGTTVGSTAATLKGATNGTINTGTTPMTLNYNGTQPAFYVSQGTLVLGNNTVIINASAPLAAGTYVLGQSATNSILASGQLTAYGTAIPALSTNTTLVVSNNLLLLTINSPFAYPVNTQTAAAGQSGQTVVSSPAGSSWWTGTNNALFGTAGNWSGTSTSITAGTVPGATAGSGVGVFNYPSSNSIETVTVNTTYNPAGLIFNSTGATTLSNSTAAATLSLYGFTNFHRSADQ